MRFYPCPFWSHEEYQTPTAYQRVSHALRLLPRLMCWSYLLERAHPVSWMLVSIPLRVEKSICLCDDARLRPIARRRLIMLLWPSFKKNFRGFEGPPPLYLCPSLDRIFHHPPQFFHRHQNQWPVTFKAESAVWSCSLLEAKCNHPAIVGEDRV